MSMAEVVARNSGQGRQRERKADRLWIDREMTSEMEIGIVVYVEEEATVPPPPGGKGIFRIWK